MSWIEPRKIVSEFEGGTATWLSGGSEEHRQAEAELLKSGVQLPIPHRAVWATNLIAASFWFLLLSSRVGAPIGGFMVRAARIRAFPGYLRLRSERFGASIPDSVLPEALPAIVDLLNQDRRIVELDLEVFEPLDNRRALLGDKLAGVGFRAASLSRSYRSTLAADLSLPDDARLAALSANTRRDVRAIAKFPVVMKTVDDEAYAPHMERLVSQTFSRTGSHSESQDWRSIISLSRAEPRLSRVVGLFRCDASAPENLIAFAWACNHGEYAHYEASGSSRPTDLRIPFSYCLLWDLQCWARANGARWFDLGGVPENVASQPPLLAGISNFKRHFGKTALTVGERWLLEPNPARATVARALSTIGRAVVSAVGSFSHSGSTK